MAQIYKNHGQYAEAEPLYKRALAINEKALGSDHLDVATCLENLAALFRATNRYEEALELEQRASKIRYGVTRVSVKNILLRVFRHKAPRRSLIQLAGVGTAFLGLLYRRRARTFSPRPRAEIVYVEGP